MSSLTRAPHPALGPVVRSLWASQTAQGSRHGVEFERSVPTGLMHLVFRLSPGPLVVADDEHGTNRRTLGHALVGGARSRFHVREVSQPANSVGAMLLPGAARRLFGVTAKDLSERHTSLFDLWGPGAELLLERLLSARSPEARMDVLEAELVVRLSREDTLHPDVAQALFHFDRGEAVGTVVRETGLSHRHFLARFRETVGLTPKIYSRVIRVQRAITVLRKQPDSALAEIALSTGFADQAHFTREIVHVAGVSPAHYRKLRSLHMNHLPICSSKDHPSTKSLAKS